MPEVRLHTPMARSVLLASDWRRQGSILSTAFTLATDSTPSIIVKVSTTSNIGSHRSGSASKRAKSGATMPSRKWAGMAMRSAAGKPAAHAASAPSADTPIAGGSQRHTPPGSRRHTNISASPMSPISAGSACACASCPGKCASASSTDLEGTEGAPTSAGSWRTMIMMPMDASIASTTVTGSRLA